MSLVDFYAQYGGYDRAVLQEGMSLAANARDIHEYRADLLARYSKTRATYGAAHPVAKRFAALVAGAGIVLQQAPERMSQPEIVM